MIVKGHSTNFTELYASGSGILLKQERWGESSINHMPEYPDLETTFPNENVTNKYGRYLFSVVTDVISNNELRCLLPSAQLSGSRYGKASSGTNFDGYSSITVNDGYRLYNGRQIIDPNHNDPWYEQYANVGSTLILRVGPLINMPGYDGENPTKNYIYTPPLEVKYKGIISRFEFQGQLVELDGFAFYDIPLAAGLGLGGIDVDPIAQWINSLPEYEKAAVEHAITAGPQNYGGFCVYYQVWTPFNARIMYYNDIHECSDIFTESDLTADNYFTTDITSGIHYKKERVTRDVRDKVVIVKNNLGNVYWPEYDFNGLPDGTLNPGEGYQIKTTEELESGSFPIHAQDTRPIIEQ